MTLPRTLAKTMSGAMTSRALRGAGQRGLVDLEHVGRRTGTIRHTALRGWRVGDEVVVGLNFGPTSDWYRNLVAAGRARMRVGDEVVELGPARLVDVATGTAGMPGWFAWGLRHVLRTRWCVRMPVLAARPIDETDWPQDR